MTETENTANDKLEALRWLGHGYLADAQITYYIKEENQ